MSNAAHPCVTTINDTFLFQGCHNHKDPWMHNFNQGRTHKLSYFVWFVRTHKFMRPGLLWCGLGWQYGCDYKSTSCYVFLLGNGTISWNNKQQTFFVMSSIEVEYMVVSQATKQVMWLPSLFGSIGIPWMKPIIIYDNNESYISLWKDLVFHVRMKHI